MRFPSVRPSWERPCEGKYNVQNSLPSIFHGIDPPESSSYDVEIHHSCLPPDDRLQDSMNAIGATENEATLPAVVSSSSVVQEDESANANVPAVLPTSKEHAKYPPIQVINSYSTATSLSPIFNEQEGIDSNYPSPAADLFHHIHYIRKTMTL